MQKGSSRVHAGLAQHAWRQHGSGHKHDGHPGVHGCRTLRAGTDGCFLTRAGRYLPGEKSHATTSVRAKTCRWRRPVPAAAGVVAGQALFPRRWQGRLDFQGRPDPYGRSRPADGRGGAVHVQDIARADTFHPGGPDHDGWQGHARVAVDCGAGGTTAGSGTADADVVRQSGLTGAPPSAGRDGVREPGPGAFKGLQGKATPRAAPRTAARLNAA